MTKKDLVINISEETGMNQIQVKKVVDSLLKNVIASLKNNKKIELREFGVFKVKTRRPRMGRNPKTGDVVNIPEKKVCIFKPGKSFREM